MKIGLDMVDDDDAWVNDGWPILLVLKDGVRGGEELGRLFPCEDPFFEFFLGEFCCQHKQGDFVNQSETKMLIQ